MKEDLTLNITAIGGPTALIEVAGFRFITDPTFDEAGGEYPSGKVALKKNQGPAVPLDHLPPVDLVLLSHDQHADNLDAAGRKLLSQVQRVFTTTAGAGRLGLGAGMEPWESIDVAGGPGVTFQITAAPARHGPAGIEPITGDVIGFVVTHKESGRDLFYFTGDTCWFEGVAEVSRRFKPEVILLNAGAAQTRGPFHLTMNCFDALETAAHFPQAKIVPLHHDGWEHFRQSAEDLAAAFTALGKKDRLQLLEPGKPREFTPC